MSKTSDLYIRRAPIRQTLLGWEENSKGSSDFKGIRDFAFKVRILFDFLSL